ncbi:hypothetical protein QGM71_09945 [Virgibacillus sp. C22-A2]|uniref:Uncharacterized protein n=1 Tax=Virgibacillus tibetensis TaxID=3042313 RepID=A0ABU6KH54_9BACI|nr:hypothetical protein [Virgibacillus sp. C22-A2]
MGNYESTITKEMLTSYYKLTKRKKEIDQELNQLKKKLNNYFDDQVGVNNKGEFEKAGYKLQRQIRKTEKFNDDIAVPRLEEMNMTELIKVIKRTDDSKIKSAINLGLLAEDDLDDCKVISYTAAITVKSVT